MHAVTSTLKVGESYSILCNKDLKLRGGLEKLSRVVDLEITEIRTSDISKWYISMYRRSPTNLYSFPKSLPPPLMTLGPPYPPFTFDSHFSHPLQWTKINLSPLPLLLTHPPQFLDSLILPHLFTFYSSSLPSPPPYNPGFLHPTPLFSLMLMNSVTQLWHIYKMCFWCQPMMAANYLRPQWFIPDLYDLISQVWLTCITCR